MGAFANPSRVLAAAAAAASLAVVRAQVPTANPLVLALQAGGAYSVSVPGWDVQLTGGETALLAGGKWLSSADGSLPLQAGADVASGSDAWGAFNATTLTWGAAGGPQVRTTFRVYATTPAIVFETTFPAAVTTGAPSGGRENVSSSFPSWVLPASSTAGFIQYHGAFINDGYNGPTFGEWGASARLTTGLKGGPIVLFDKTGQHTLIYSAASSFMAVNTATFRGTLHTGALGSAATLPAGWSHSSVLWYGSAGINPAVTAWGAALLDRFGKTRALQQSDVTGSTLTYNTDHGVYYYYLTEKGKDYLDTLKDVYAYATAAGIPYKTVLLDSWWYFKGIGDGVKNWTAMPSIFAGGNAGLRNLTATTGWHVIAHNRYWSKDTSYAKQNGGAWDFFLDDASGQMGVPLQQEFWETLLGGSRREWGLTTYEQDWLYNMIEGVSLLTTDVTAARTWLLQMNAGASAAGVPIQFCMAYPRHALESLEMPQVTQIRASDDHVPSMKPQLSTQWRIGYSSLFAWSIALAPFKDGWYSTVVQPGGSVGNSTETSPALQGAISTLSAGPVAPGDGVGYSDVGLILRSCTSGGRLLQPSRAATAIDAGFRARVWGGASGPLGEVYATRSVVSGRLWHHVLSAALGAAYSLAPADLAPHDAEVPPPVVPDAGRVAYSLNTQTLAPATLFVRAFSPASPIPLVKSSEPVFELWHTAPLFANGWAVLGELTKWVPVAAARVADVTEDGAGVTVSLTGEAGEAVPFTFWSAGTGEVTVACVLGADGTAVAAVPAATCA